MKHQHKWERTGDVAFIYTGVREISYRCECGAKMYEARDYVTNELVDHTQREREVDESFKTATKNSKKEE